MNKDNKFIDDFAREMEDMGVTFRENTRADLRESKHGKLKLLAYDSIPFILGAAAGGISRLVGHPEITLILPAGSLLVGGGFPSTSKDAIKMVSLDYLKYGIGAALPFSDKIYAAASELIKQL